jgi:hypothetical protein
VVTYTGTGSARTIAHSLGIAPGMVIVKRTDTSSDWQVYSNGLTSAAYSTQLNLTAAQASAPTVWNSTAPTSSVFSVGTDATVNASGGTYVAYLFAHNAGGFGLSGTDNVISCGSFTTDGAGAATVSLGYEPQWLMFKASSGAGSWFMYDNMRGFGVTSGSNNYLLANSSGAENNGGSIPLVTSTGFSVTAAASTTYIYMAIRMPNKPPTSGTQVYNVFTSTSTETTSTPATSNITDDLFLNVARDGGYCVPFDRLRGAGIRLFTQATDAEQVTSTGAAFDVQTGIRWLGSYSNVPVNRVNYHFKRAPGFFDEVCYTGTGSAGQSISHNLTVVPELILLKRRNGASDWNVGVKFTAIGYANLNLNNTDPENTYSYPGNFYGLPTATVFTLNNYVNINGAGNTFVAYLFATLAGISKVGSYTGNGTGQAIACGFSAGARFVLIKRTDSTGDWYTFDSVSGLTSGSSPYILLNSNATPVTGNNGVYASTGGFTLGSTASTTTNINAATYIFLAVA